MIYFGYGGESEPISTILYYYLERGANMPEESKVSKAQQKAVNKYVKKQLRSH